MKDFIEQKVKELLKPLQKRDWNSAEEVDKYFETEIRTALTQTADQARVEERERVDKEVLTPLYDEIQSWYVEKGDIVGQGALIHVFDEAMKNLTK